MDPILLEYFLDDDEVSSLVAQHNIPNEACQANTFLRELPIALSSMLVRNNHSRISEFMATLQQQPDEDFYKEWRITKSNYFLLIKMLEEHGIFQSAYPRGRPRLTIEISVALALSYLGHQIPYQQIANQFGVSLSAMHRNVYLIFDFLNDLASKVIKWPEGDKISEVVEGFKNYAQVPGVIGAIESCYIKVRPPAESKAYLDKHMNHSVKLMAVCDHTGAFTYIYAGYPGSASNQTVFSQSSLGMKMESDPLSLCHSNDYHMIGDSSFALSNYMIVPFEDCANSTNVLLFNNRLALTKSVTENSLKLLKNRFRRLKFIGSDILRLPKIVTAACVLHNIALSYEEDHLLREVIIDNGDDSDSDSEDFNIEPLSAEAIEKRANMLK